ncbi:NADH-quinone oxidoreductase subunit N [Calidithermus chliarophilus]|uniref:NADH-quinone oxidoreductase subunit N n=1 Tax=Calidithermus chliarophilus TaxID=52023 RepID=UPI0004148133|nr:proton-conducting transporter membrane subunit [Calidithermus chliarophilus]
MITLYLLGAASVVLTLLGFFVPARVTRWVAVGSVGATLAYLFFTWGQEQTAFGGLYVVDSVSQGFTMVALLGVLWALILGRTEKWEFPLLLVYAATGMHFMASSPNLPVLLVALEVFSLPLYVLATWRRDERGFEAGLKYFLLGALSAAIFLYGIALHFGATGSFNAGAEGSGPLYVTALLLILGALAFKVSLVPFHWWTPDVYQGSPTTVSLMMATAVKAAGFAALVRVLDVQDQGLWGLGLGALIALTVVFGNLGALAQRESKRLLAYSSIAHAGYVGLGLFSGTGAPAIGFYLLAYALSTGLAFAVLAAVSQGDVPYERLRGLLYRKPVLGVAMGIGLLSLAGLPPFAGFWGKLLVFLEAARAQQWGLLVLALLTSAVAAYYYLRLFNLLIDRRQEAREEGGAPVAAGLAGTPVLSGQGAGGLSLATGRSSTATLVVAAALVVLLGILPGWGYRLFSPVPFAALSQAAAQPAALPATFAITSPSDGAELRADEFSLQGTGNAGETLEVYDNGTKLADVTVGENGGWSLTLPSLPAPGEHTYQVRRPGESEGPSVRVKILE